MLWKKVILLVLALLGTQAPVYAETVVFQSKSDTYTTSRVGWATRISGSFGQMPGTGEYGIFVTVRQRQNPDERNSRTNKKLFFTPADGKLEALDGKLYYVSPAGRKFLVADKRFWGWRQADNIEVYTWLVREPGKLRVKVEMDIY